MDMICKECGAVYMASNGHCPTCMKCFCGCTNFKQEVIQEV